MTMLEEAKRSSKRDSRQNVTYVVHETADGRRFTSQTFNGDHAFATRIGSKRIVATFARGKEVQP